MIDEAVKLLSDFEYLTGSNWYIQINADGTVRLVEKVGRGREQFNTFEDLLRYLRKEVA